MGRGETGGAEHKTKWWRMTLEGRRKEIAGLEDNNQKIKRVLFRREVTWSIFARRYCFRSLTEFS